MEIKPMMDGMLDGQVVWICHYNRPDMNKKPLRNIPPTKVLIRSNDELPKGKKIYYSKSHFVALNKEDKPTSKIHSPVDNTGHRSYSGNPLFMFETEAECNGSWNAQLREHIGVIDNLISNAKKHWEDEREKLSNELKGDQGE